MEAMSSANEDDGDKEPRHRQRRKESRKRTGGSSKSPQIPNPHTQKRLQITNPTTESHVKVGKGPKSQEPKGDTEMQHERGHGGHPEQMRSRKEIKVEAAKAANPAHHERIQEEGTQPTTVPPSTRTKPKCPQRFLEAGKLYIDPKSRRIRPIPLVQCAMPRLLGTQSWQRHGNRRRSHRSGQNDSDDSSESPEIQSSDCRVTPAGDRERDIDSFGSGTLRKPRHPKTKSRTKVIQCTVGRQKPVKAAIIVFGDKVEVLHDPQLVTETESAVPLKIGRMKLGISIYFEGDEDIEPISSERKGLQNLGTKSDHSWRHKCLEPLVGKPERRQRGQAYRVSWTKWASTSSTREALPPSRPIGDRICSSIVDVTACSSPLIESIIESGQNGNNIGPQRDRVQLRLSGP
ncbi:hypothetical protein EVAR_85903_1 [Eumeta japonica]|uniref:Uncharacterized protein n=1 Tax=Eumeta variegata TaxID=151549 RepID=A0A4C2A531_EUMVA|nr:hypothetical protein EVAR_85903_1 [Eumeta japonica]